MKQCSIIFSYVLPKPNELPRSLNPRADKARRFKPAFMAWLDDIVGDWNDSSGNHYQVGGWLSGKFSHMFFWDMFFFSGQNLKKTQHNVCMKCVCFFSVVFFHHLVSTHGSVTCWFFGAFWVPFLASEVSITECEGGFLGFVKKRGTRFEGPQTTKRPKPTITPPMFNSSPLKNGGFSRPVGFW